MTSGNEKSPSGGSSSVIRAAEYVRMSTEHQRYSTENQADAIRAYAARRNFQIVRTYQDQGKSGLNIGGRDGLRSLLADVVGGKADYSVVLVYDVSRWGRFQDADESAYYEYQCKRAGVRVAERNEAGLDAYRFETLLSLYELMRRVPLKEVA